MTVLSNSNNAFFFCRFPFFSQKNNLLQLYYFSRIVMPVPKKKPRPLFRQRARFFVVLSVDWSVGWFHSWLSAGHTLVSLLVHWSFIQYLHRHYKLLHICRSYYNLLNHMYKASLHAPFIFHATFT